MCVIEASTSSGSVSNMVGGKDKALPSFWIPSLTPEAKETVLQKPVSCTPLVVVCMTFFKNMLVVFLKRIQCNTTECENTIKGFSQSSQRIPLLNLIFALFLKFLTHAEFQFSDAQNTRKILDSSHMKITKFYCYTFYALQTIEEFMVTERQSVLPDVWQTD